MDLLLKNVGCLVKYNELQYNIDIGIRNGLIECIGNCSNEYDAVIDCSKCIVHPCLSIPYIKVSDYSRIPSEKTIDVLKLLVDNGVVAAVFSSPLKYNTDSLEYKNYVLKKQLFYLKSILNLVGNKIDSLYKSMCILNRSPNSYNDIVRVCRTNADKLVMPFLVTKKEVFNIHRKTGKWPLEYMEYEGLFDSFKEIMFVYMNWLSSMDIEVLKKYRDKVRIFVSPTKTMELANGGFTPVYELLETGIWVGITTHDIHSCIVREAELTYLLYKYNYLDERLSKEIVWKILLNNNELFLLDKDISIGKNACLVVRIASNLVGKLCSYEYLFKTIELSKVKYIILKDVIYVY